MLFKNIKAFIGCVCVFTLVAIIALAGLPIKCVAEGGNSIIIEGGPLVIKIPTLESACLLMKASVLDPDGAQVPGASIVWSLPNTTDNTVSIDSSGLLTLTSSSIQQLVTVKAALASDPSIYSTEDINVTGGAQYALFENFNSLPTGTFVQGTNSWTVKNESANASVNVIEDPSNTDKSIKLTNINVPTTYSSIEYYPPSQSCLTNQAVMEVDVKFNNSIATWAYPLRSDTVVLITAYSSADKKYYVYYRQYKDSNGNDIPQSNWQKVTEVLPNTWYHLKVVYDFRPKASGGQKASVYVNYSNQPALADMPFYDARYDFSKLNGFAAWNNTTAGASIQIDNVVMSDPNRLDVMQIEGSTVIDIPTAGSITSNYSVGKFKAQGGAELTAVPSVTWFLSNAPEGVAVNSTTGVITVPSGIRVGKEVLLTAQCGSIVSTKKVMLNSSDINISEVSLNYADGRPVSLFEAGAIVEASAIIQNASSIQKPIAFIAALYTKEGILKQVSVCPQKLLLVTENRQTLTVTLNLPSIIDDEYIKVYLWDEMENAIPIIKPLTYYNLTRPMTIYIASDSIAANYDSTYYPQAGWGMYIGESFTNEVTIANKATGGRSAKSFIAEGRLDQILNVIKPGDYLIIEFAHNDGSSDPNRYTDPGSTYRQYLKQYVNSARAKGAVPVFITSPSPLKFVNGVATNPLINYTQAMLEVANDRSINVPCIDLNAKMLAYYNQIGEERCKNELFLYNLVDQGLLTTTQLGAHPNTVLAANGYDSTHYRIEGARKICQFIAEGIHELQLPIRRLLK